MYSTGTIRSHFPFRKVVDCYHTKLRCPSIKDEIESIWNDAPFYFSPHMTNETPFQLKIRYPRYRTHSTLFAIYSPFSYGFLFYSFCTFSFFFSLPLEFFLSQKALAVKREREK